VGLTRVLAASVVVVLATVLVACGDDDDGGTSPTAALSATPSAGEPADPSDVLGETVAPTDATDAPPAVTDPAPTLPPATDAGLLTPVDKEHSLAAEYVPPGLAALPDAYLAPGFGAQLRQEALDALVQLLDAAETAGYDIRCRSGYRSYAEQETTFNYWVSVLGYEEAVRVSAMPGHSEHQLGTACDLTSPEVGWDLIETFGETAPGQWLASHAHEYGFALSYPPGKEAITGYAYEPWHFRYIGTGRRRPGRRAG
jgi:D-alanyl-D-alanine carboxypeptidase